MKHILYIVVLSALMAGCTSTAYIAHYAEDDIYYIPGHDVSKDSHSSYENRRPEKRTSPRRSQDGVIVGYWLNDFNGTEADMREIERIIDMYPNGFGYFANGNQIAIELSFDSDWNVFTDGNGRYWWFPSASNIALYSSLIMGTYPKYIWTVVWNEPRFDSWQFDNYFNTRFRTGWSWHLGWDHYYGYPHRGWRYDPFWEFGPGYYPYYRNYYWDWEYERYYWRRHNYWWGYDSYWNGYYDGKYDRRNYIDRRFINSDKVHTNNYGTRPSYGGSTGGVHVKPYSRDNYMTRPNTTRTNTTRTNTMRTNTTRPLRTVRPGNNPSSKIRSEENSGRLENTERQSNIRYIVPGKESGYARPNTTNRRSNDRTTRTDNFRNNTNKPAFRYADPRTRNFEVKQEKSRFERNSEEKKETRNYERTRNTYRPTYNTRTERSQPLRQKNTTARPTRNQRTDMPVSRPTRSR